MTKSATREAADEVSAPVASPVFTGNVGVGVTPEGDIVADRPHLRIGSTTALSGSNSNDQTYLSNNAKQVTTAHASGWEYLITDYASQYKQKEGTHVFQVAPSGTADAAISWTTPLTITNDGRGLSEFTAKAWCKFAANGTSSNLTYGHNVSSVSYVATGHWRIHYTNSLTYNYSAQMMVSDNGGRNTTFKVGEFEQSYCGVFISNMSQIGTNAAVACFTAFGE